MHGFVAAPDGLGARRLGGAWWAWGRVGLAAPDGPGARRSQPWAAPIEACVLRAANFDRLIRRFDEALHARSLEAASPCPFSAASRTGRSRSRLHGRTCAGAENGQGAAARSRQRAKRTATGSPLRAVHVLRSSQGPAARCRRASKRAMPVATETLRLSTSAAMGIRARKSQVSRVRRRRPSPSPPMTIAVGAVRSSW